MVPWIECPTIDLDWDRPPALRYADVPDQVVEHARLLLAAIENEIPARAKLLADAIRLRTAGRFHAEVKALADRVGAGWRTVLLGNVSYDLSLAIMGCSTVALPTAAGPVLARNMDWWPEDILARTTYRIRGFQNGRLAFAHAGWPGAVGVVTGLSARGFAVALNAVLCPDGVDRTGYPVLLHIRRVLDDAEDFDSAVKMLSEQRLAAPCLLTLVGRQNDQRVVIERSPRRCAIRRPEPGKPLVTTNDYRLLYKPKTSDESEIYQTTCDRFTALSRFFADHRPDQAVEDVALLYVLSDPVIIQGITAQHVIARPAANELRVFVPRRLVEPPSCGFGPFRAD